MSALALSGYFAGYTTGAVRSALIIGRVGHVRAYAALGPHPDLEHFFLIPPISFCLTCASDNVDIIQFAGWFPRNKDEAIFLIQRRRAETTRV